MDIKFQTIPKRRFTITHYFKFKSLILSRIIFKSSEIKSAVLMELNAILVGIFSFSTHCNILSKLLNAMCQKY
mgnify:CR=1 FL=1